MKKSFTLFALFAILAFSLIGQEWIPLASDTPTPLSQQLIQSDDQSVIIKFDIEGFFMKTVETPKGKEYIISIPKAVSMTEAEAPDLPRYGVSAIIPDLDLMKVRVLDYSYTDFEGIAVAPSKGDFPRSIDPESIPYVYGDAYDRDEFFPDIRAELQEPYILRDFRGQVVTIYPISYNPIRQVLRVYHEMTVEIFSDGIGGENQFQRQSEVLKMDREFKHIYNHQFINYGEFSRYPILEEEGNMLVISHGPFMEAMEPFIEWKKTIGRPIEMVDVSTIGTSPSAIKSFITDYYNDNGLTHLLLVGDHQQVPSQSMSGGFSDNFYGYLVGNDSYNELFVGRFSAESVAHVETQVQKVIEYERDMNESDTWLNIGMGIARNEGTGSGHYGENDYVHMDFIRDSLLNYTYVNVYREYDGNVPGVPNTNSTQMMQRFNDGVSITNFCNHGHQNGWSVGNFSSTHVNQLTNVGKLPFIWSVACDNGRFTNGTCFAEVWMRATHNGEPSGAIATMMSWISQPWQPPMTGQDEMVTILVEGYANNIKRTFGGNSINGSMRMIDQHGTSGRSTHDTWILFGDPSLTVRTDVPSAIAVDHMPAVFLGFTEFTVNADAEDAIVALTMDGEIIGTAYVENGVAVVEFDALEEPGEMTVAVFAYNRITYIETIEVIPAAGPFLALNSFEIDDSEGGNNNGIIDYGETIVLGVALKNLGIENATGVIASISTESDYINIIEGDQEYGIIEPDEILMIEDAFLFEVVDGIPHDTPILFDLNIVGNEDTWTGTINLTASAPTLVVGSYIVDDATGNDNGRLDAGETADIIITTENLGGSESVDALGSILLSDPWITVNSSEFEFGSIEAGETVYAVFNVTADINTPIGHFVEFMYTVEAGEYMAEKEFAIKVGLILEDFESGDFSQFDWTFSGNQPWIITNILPIEGNYCARSGMISHNQQTRMILEYNVGTADTISFYRRVSSESGYDFLKFYINGVPVGQWSGNVSWGKVSFPVSAGPKTFMWEYMKDNVVSSGEDAAWVDFISFPPPVATTGSAGNDAEICETETHQLNGMATYYNTVEWTTSGTGTFSDPHILDPVYTPGDACIDAGEVVLTLTIDGMTAVITDEVNLTIHKNPEIYAGDNTSICLGDIYEIKDALADNYDLVVWETSGTGTFDNLHTLHPNYVPSNEDYESGMVILSVTAHGFESCDEAHGSFELHFNDLPTAEITGTQEICLGESAELTLTLTGEAPWFVTIEGIEGTVEVPASPHTMQVGPELTTTYNLLSVMDGNACENEASGEVIITLNYAPDAPVTPMGSDTVDHFLVESSVYQIEEVDNADAYEWNIMPEHAGTIAADGTTATIIWNTEFVGQAELSAIAVNDCGLSEASPAITIELYSTVGLSENQAIQASIYPNPSEGIFNISLFGKTHAEAKLSVRTMMGELVYTEMIQVDSRAISKTLNLSYLSNGSYILSIENTDGKTIKRIIIQK